MTVPMIRLDEQVSVPQVGVGVFEVPHEDTAKVLLTAFEAGYRHIDTAQSYLNETEVGHAVRDSGLPRESFFVTTKLHMDRLGYDSAMRALGESLRRLRMDYVDLFLIHWPLPDEDRYLSSWEAMQVLKDDGKARVIGVSNLQVVHLERLAQRSSTVPAVNQIELHPNVAQAELRAYHSEHGIVTQAWRPIAKGLVLGDRTLVGLAAKYGKTPAQVVLRWHIQLGNVVIPKTVTPSRLRENIDIFDFEISDADMALIGTLDGDPAGVPARTVEAGIPTWQPSSWRT
jgi:2,5-diketo-D-gluconate reductase A